ncbi:zinc-finger domain-containing protein [Metabacillus indicus]|uniref:zinc-finger domain-containing protein n=1 Tax=Metabacillus indicus TaxID=246786 RepID=UPI002A02A06C|nr:zinc-finger domain-containing protein [Metabacillus indicus]MDX8288854.1 zinc-finger domain-containing protein [Metabacillus indicus]
MSSIKKQRLSVLWEIDSLKETHCDNCEADPNKREANECVKCPVRTNIRALGEQLGRAKGKSNIDLILSKGQDMTKSDIEFLLENEVSKKQIFKSLQMGSAEFYKLLEAWGFYQSKTKGETDVEFTKEAYQAVKNEGKTDKEIKAIFGIDQNKLYKMKREWNLITHNKPSWSKSEDEYKSLIGKLKDELQGRDDLIGKLEATIQKYQEQPANDEQIKELNEKVAQMESACADVEDELASFKCRFASSERERAIAEDNLQQANRSLRDKEAEVKTLQHELSYARENVKRAQEIETLFRNTLKVVL